MKSTASDIGALEKSLHDLLSLLSLPAMWAGRSVTDLVAFSLHSLESLIALDVAYVRVPETDVFREVEVVHTWRPPTDRDALQRSLRSAEVGAVIAGAYDGPLQIVSAPLGPFGQHGTIVFGSLRAGFPSSAEHVLLRTVASLLASGIESSRLLETSRAARTEAETLYRLSEAITETQFDLDLLAQRITDEATQLVGAQFGALFYNVSDDRGESYSLFTISGVDRAEFAKFPMPRKTAVFAPTFDGVGVVRSDDITKDARYGKSAPHYGTPPGHLPVRSYLAVPVISRTGEVVAGLFLGHPDTHRFTAAHERIIKALGSAAAIAIDNATLFRDSVRDKQIHARRARDSALAASIGASLTRNEPLGLVLQECCEHIMRHFDTAAVSAWVAEKGSGGLTLVAKAGSVPSADTALLDFPLRVETEVVGALVIQAPKALEEEISHAVSQLTGTLAIGIRRLASEGERDALVAELQRTVRFNETFAGMLGHDLRNPLGSAINAAQLLLRRSPDERMRRPLERIVSSGERMSRMIDQLLDFTRTRVGTGLTLNPAPIELRDVMANVVEEIAYAHPTTKIASSWDGNTHGVWDADRLSQLFANLIGNAAQHGEGQIISVDMIGNDDGVSIEVSNAGRIPKELMPILFDPFRGTRHRRDGSRGMGLGLYISKQIALAHGGDISALSDEDGTRFLVRLPRETA